MDLHNTNVEQMQVQLVGKPPSLHTWFDRYAAWGGGERRRGGLPPTCLSTLHSSYFRSEQGPVGM